MYKCSYCHLTSKKKWKIQVHETRKHKSDSRAPNVMSVGPDGPRAPTTVSVPPQHMGVQYGSGSHTSQYGYGVHAATAIKEAVVSEINSIDPNKIAFM